MKKIKLPRKRKKAYIKARSGDDYFSMTLIGEVNYEDDPQKKYTKYPEFKTDANGILQYNRKRKPIVAFNW